MGEGEKCSVTCRLMFSILDISLRGGMLKAAAGSNAMSVDGKTTRTETIYPAGHLMEAPSSLPAPKSNAKTFKCFGKRLECMSDERNPLMVTRILCGLMIMGVAFFAYTSVEAGHGPGNAKLNPKLGMMVDGSFDMTCAFFGGDIKVAVIYHRVAKEWEPKLSCNDTAGNPTSRNVPADKSDPQLMITGWYADGKRWKQCDFKKWRDDPNGRYLSCQTPKGGTLKLTCATGKCAKP